MTYVMYDNIVKKKLAQLVLSHIIENERRCKAENSKGFV